MGERIAELPPERVLAAIPRCAEWAARRQGAYSRLQGYHDEGGWSYARIERDFEAPVGCGLHALYWEGR